MELGVGEICGSATGTLGGCGDLPALGSRLQLPVQSHREAEEATRLAFLAQGAHHIQIEGDSPRGEQSGHQGAKKVTNPGAAPRIAARSPGHGRTLGALPTSARKLARARSRRSPTAGLWSRVSQVFQGSRNLSPHCPSPSAPPPRCSTSPLPGCPSTR